MSSSARRPANGPKTSEEDLARVTVGEVRRLDGPVRLAEYDPAWPARYEAEAERIAGALGAAALRVEHVGSTSVPGLVAKPIIDIVLAVADPADEPAYVPALERAGYELRIREPEWLEHRMLRSAAADVQIHVFATGCPEIDRMILFRDRMRADPAARERYAAVKRELAARNWRYVQHYADAKTAVIDEIVRG